MATARVRTTPFEVSDMKSNDGFIDDGFIQVPIRHNGGSLPAVSFTTCSPATAGRTSAGLQGESAETCFDFESTPGPFARPVCDRILRSRANEVNVKKEPRVFIY